MQGPVCPNLILRQILSYGWPKQLVRKRHRSRLLLHPEPSPCWLEESVWYPLLQIRWAILPIQHKWIESTFHYPSEVCQDTSKIVPTLFVFLPGSSAVPFFLGLTYPLFFTIGAAHSPDCDLKSILPYLSLGDHLVASLVHRLLVHISKPPESLVSFLSCNLTYCSFTLLSRVELTFYSFCPQLFPIISVQGRQQHSNLPSNSFSNSLIFILLVAPVQDGRTLQTVSNILAFLFSFPTGGFLNSWNPFS